MRVAAAGGTLPGRASRTAELYHSLMTALAQAPRREQDLPQLRGMTWLTALAAAVVVVAIVALFGVQPRGGRNASGTRLMSVGRAVLLIGVLIVAWLMLRAA